MKILRSQDIIYALGHVDPVEFLSFTSLNVSPENVQYGYMSRDGGPLCFAPSRMWGYGNMKPVTLTRENGERVFG